MWSQEVPILLPIEFVSSIVLVLTLLIMIKEYQKDIKTRKQDLYATLELSSIKLFQLIIERPELAKIYDTQIDINKLSDHEKNSLENYVASLLNLFEIHFNLRLSKSIEPEIFASWLPWFYELCISPGFKQLWDKILWKHYVPQFRNFINSLIETIENNNESSKEKAFYEKASELLGNDIVIKNWLGYHLGKKRKV
jgi:hypothetical protein